MTIFFKHLSPPSRKYGGINNCRLRDPNHCYHKAMVMAMVIVKICQKEADKFMTIGQ
jgi:hypothetical protein